MLTKSCIVPLQVSTVATPVRAVRGARRRVRIIRQAKKQTLRKPTCSQRPQPTTTQPAKETNKQATTRTMSTPSPNDFEVPNMDDFLGGPDREQRSAEMHASLMEFLTESESMRKTAKSSLKQSMYAGGGAFAGSFIGGPVGGLIGGIAGSLVGFFQSDNYDGLLLAVSKIDDTHRTHLLKVSVRIKSKWFERILAFYIGGVTSL